LGAVRQLRGGWVAANAHGGGHLVLNVGFWTPVGRTINQRRRRPECLPGQGPGGPGVSGRSPVPPTCVTSHSRTD